MDSKDEEAAKCVRVASKASVAFMTKYFAKEMSTIIDEERKIKHVELADKIEDKIDDANFLKSKNVKLGSDFDQSQLDWRYSPIIQSGGKYDLRPSAGSDEETLHGGVILCSLGMQYKSFCSNMGRTYLIDPNKTQEKYYNFLVQLQRKVFEMLKDGANTVEVHSKTIAAIKAKYPELVGHFIKTMGWRIGAEFRDKNFLINAKSSGTIKEGMTLNISLGFQDLTSPNTTDPRGKTYSLLLIDTVLITKDFPVVLTDSPKEQGDISYYFKDEEELQDEKKEKAPKKEKPANTAVLKSKLRGEARNVDESAEIRRRGHQAELHQRRQEEGMARYAGEKKSDDGEKRADFKKFEAYKRESQLPVGIKDLRIAVDPKNQAIVVPISGRPVPFHISTLKNASKNEEGEYVYLRLNFLTPGQGVGRKDNLPFEDADAQFIRSLTFRSRDVERMADVFRSIQDMKKNAVKKEMERKELEDVVEQDSLVEVKNRRPLRLDNVFVRPAPDGKRVPGTLEIHQNGLRYQSPVRSDQRIDLLFGNIQHLFFQPCDHELIVLIHAHLKNPIMIGKRKTKDVQFYREASDIQFDETGNRKRKYRYGDEDELEAEQEERKRRAALNKEFHVFSEKIAETSNNTLDVDVPFRELGFNGVPFRANVLCQPTTDCLVQLIDPPFLVIPLKEIEIAHFERVQFGLKNFDLVFVFKDFSKPVVHINSIPMEQLDNVKDWIDEVEIPYSEGPLNLNWQPIMKAVVSDPYSFFKEGGWSFLSNESSDEEGDGEESEESNFEVSDEDPSDESQSESEFDDDEGSYDGSDAEDDDDDDEESDYE
ncbi:FACT complex subunit-domain-containing protein [Dipodascopsis tothii]|uniref:FACT complex subunit-domain-containing protein n=1 Tax=Dipodascopsis tothii TaxID=44089 RepID=UPI0034CF4C21